jgi:hypothetical protein
MMRPVRVRSIEEAELVIQSLLVNIEQLQHRVRDMEKRFDTLQSPWWKRVWFAIDGWPWYDLNSTQRHRPWHRRT